MNKISDIYSFKKGFTHAGSFHADDVFSTAFIKILNPKIQIERGFSVPENYDGIVYDIGLGKFDHHQKDRRERENGVAYAAFGLLWEAYGCELFDEAAITDFDEDFIQPLDISDNTGEKHPLALAIADYLPPWTEKEEDRDERKAFDEAVEFAKNILLKRFKHLDAKYKAKKIVEAQMEKYPGEILYLEKVIPWKSAVKGSRFKYVIYESNRGGYNIQAVPDKEDSSALVKPFPEEWRGENADILFNLTGINSFRFCHLSGFLCATDTYEDAVKVAELALSK